VVARADELLSERGHEPLPDGVSAHKLRHTFASLLFVRGEDPPYVMAQLGHTDPAFTLRVYAHAMRRDDGDKERLKVLVDGGDWAPLGTTGPDAWSRTPGDPFSRKGRNPRICEGFGRWARLVSNQRPLACEGRAGTSDAYATPPIPRCSVPSPLSVRALTSPDVSIRVSMRARSSSRRRSPKCAR
jgi:hypothetical protein